jgi:5-methylcytosine-specific restriction endonuclease McrA
VQLAYWIKDRVIFRDMGICQKCGKTGIIGIRKGKLSVWEIDKLGRERLFEFHHDFPIRLGGTGDERNIKLVCQSCHRRASMLERELYKNMGGQN